MNTPNNENRKKDKLKIIRIALGILLILLSLLAAVLLIFKGCTGKEPGDPNSGFVLDDRAVEGGWNEADVSKIQEGLNAGVEEGYINISMNTTPVFADGKSEGNLMIVNESINKYPQYVVITRNDTGDTIYESKGIPVGSKIEKDTLDVALPAGTYECTAMFHNADPATGDSLGCAGAVITITVQN